MEAKTHKAVYTVVERDNKSFWVKVGVAFTNRDGSLNLKLDAVPVNGTLQVREPDPRDERRDETRKLGKPQVEAFA